MPKPPDPSRPFRMALAVWVLLGFCLNPILAQTSTWTFNEPGVSHARFSPPLSPTKVLSLALSFRTLQANGLMVYQNVSTLEEESEQNVEKLRLLRSWHLFVEMRQGHLRVGHIFDHYKDIINVGRALNDDNWHRLTLVLNQTSGQMNVSLDSRGVDQYLKAYVFGSAGRVLDWSHVHTSVQFGGLKGSRSHSFPTFIGCMKELKYSVDSAIPTQQITLEGQEGVTSGCLDQCQTQYRCHHDGRCVNLYTDFHCDCFGTGHEGRYCEQPGPTVLTFSGYEWVTYQLYQGENNRPFSDRNRVALEFKTQQPSGILLYAVGGSPYHNHITAALHNGLLRVSLAFGEEDLDFPLGAGLNDNKWHNLTIEHRGRQVTVYLDGRGTSQTINNSNFFSSLDPLAYFGGGDKFVVTRGLPVTRNYIGCMRNVYFNDHSVLYKLSSGHGSSIYQGGEKPTYGCTPMEDIPISFPNSASMLRWHLGVRGENLTVDLQFRTVRENGILFYTELVSRREGGGSDYGYMEVWIKKGCPVLLFIPSIRNEVFNQNITLPSVVNDQIWHTMRIQLQHRHAILKVDGVSANTQHYARPINHKGQLILGYGLRGYKKNEGYVGCLSNVTIQGLKLDPISLVESNSAFGLILDGCFLVDHCNQSNICEHDSKCLSDWDGVQCDCRNDHYVGKACHFSHHLPTCDAYYQAGHTKSGVYQIDADGSGDQDPMYVECSMGSWRDGQLYGATMVEHNFGLRTHVRGERFQNRRYELTYREMNRLQLIALAEASAMCEQFFKYTCHHSPITLGKKTWFKSANGQVVDYVGSADSGHCTCPDGSCGGHNCFCDRDDMEWSQDEGYSHNKDQLPIMEMTFLQHAASPGTANMTLGPFTCWGDDQQRLDNVVTFTREESHLKLHGWTSGNLAFHFKTHQHDALLLLHTSQDTLFGNMLSVKIVSEKSVEFYFRLNGTIIRERLQATRPINKGDWHSILIEHDPYNVRLSLDTARVLLPLDSVISGLLDYNGILYLGGLPDDVAVTYGERTLGMSGCIRAFLYNQQPVELAMLIDGTTSGVSTGCMSSCWPNPCQHGGTCDEDWGHYTCHCSDPWAHQGHNCQYNLNMDAVTFSGKPSSYLTFDLSNQPSPLDQTIVLSFRTLQPNALLFYLHDHLFNFLQLELYQENTILFSYNSHGAIVSGSIKSTEALNTGEWHQVVAQEYYNLTKLIFGDQSHIIEFQHIKLDSYTVNPFIDSLHKETVFMPRRIQPPSPFVRLYVGGIEEGTTDIPFLKGCVRGMRVGNYHISLAEGVKSRGNTSDLTAACESGCSEDTCKNGGYCHEQWRHGNFTCDCSESDFSGIYCEKEASVLLTGQTVLKHNFTLPLAAWQTVTEQITLTFKTSGTKVTNKRGEPLDMALIYVKSTKEKDYILAKLDSDGNVLIETNQGVGIYRMKVTGNFANGESHELVYKRKGPNMYLTLDGVKEATIVYPDYNLNEIDTIYVGGLLMDDDNTFDHITNFTGCITNTVFIPEAKLDEKIRTLKDYHMDSHNVRVYGPQVTSCSSAPPPGPSVTLSPTKNKSEAIQLPDSTMPPWRVGPAQMVTLSPPILLSSTTMPPLNTTENNATAGVVVLGAGAGAVFDDFLIVIIMAVIAGILLIVLCIAILLCCCKRRRRSYSMEKVEELELKVPLTFRTVVPIQASPQPKLAKLDEFSMISATLGPRPIAKLEAPNHLECTPNRNSLGAMPKMDPDLHSEYPIFNNRKQRPASSISEVLEELERRQNAKNNEPPESMERLPELQKPEWNPPPSRPPLSFGPITCHEVIFLNDPVPLEPIPDESEGSHISSLSDENPLFQEKTEDSSPSADESQGNPNSLLDGNGDSGYEAESRPELTEDDVTPTGDVDDFDDDDDDDTQPKLYMYNISSSDMEDSPYRSSPSRQRLLHPSTTPT